MKKQIMFLVLGLLLFSLVALGQTVKKKNFKTSQSTTATFTITVNSTLTITTTSLPSAVVGQAYSATLTAAGGVAPYTWALTSGSALPAGLTLSSAGVISGTPTTAVNNSSFSVIVTDSSH